MISAQELLSSTYRTISIHKRGLNILFNWSYNRMVRVIDISSGTPCVNLQWQRADKIIVASSGASKVPGSRRAKATTTLREPEAEDLTSDAIGTGRRCRFWPSSRRIDDLKLYLFTLSFTYTGLSIHRNFVLLPVSMALPINESA